MVDEKAIIREVEAFYRRYIEVWSRRDREEAAKYYDLPLAALGGDQGLSLVRSDTELRRWCLQVIEYEEGQGWQRTSIDQLQIWPLSTSLAQVVADINRYGKDGSLVHQARSSYMLRRRQDGWKVMTFAQVEEPFGGPGLARPVAHEH
jgi:hypothetical protein